MLKSEAALSGTQINTALASRRLTVVVPQGSGKVDSGCIHDGNRERLSGDYELHEKHVGFYVPALVILLQGGSKIIPASAKICDFGQLDFGDAEEGGRAHLRRYGCCVW